ncbi:MAG: gliding motility-associated C-terminal domain-containing protein [Chitinophagales bacterium]
MSINKTFKPIVLVFVLMVICLQAWSTHNRAGEIVYRYVGNGSNLTYEFTIITYTKLSGASGAADRDTLEINYGDGSIEALTRVSQELIEGNIADGSDIFKNSYVGTHTFPGPFTYVVSFSDPNRVDDIINIGTSVDIPFSVSDTVKILDPTFFGVNNSPQLLQPPIDNASIGIPFLHNPNAFDPDGDSLSYELIVPSQAPGIDVPAYAYPDQIAPGPNNVITINQATGEITWDAPQRVGLYNIAILIREFRNGICIGTLIRDMQIRVEDTPNNPPIVQGPREICIIAGDTLEFMVRAFDNDAGQLVELSAAGSPFQVNISPAEFTMPPLGNPVDGDFYWETVCEHLRANNYQVIFRAEDDFSDFPLSTILTTVIRVLAPPPADLTGFYDGGLDAVQLDWSDVYECGDSPLFRGYQVWRKVGCEGDPQDSCADDLAGRGYILLGQTQLTRFTDNDFIRGNEYSYRVVARFAELSAVGNIELNPFTGYPSDEFCIEFPKEIPVMYNADVQVTDQNTGEIFVAWSTPRPENIDSFVLVNPGPYAFVLKRATGIGSTTPETTLATFTANDLVDLNDTTFQDVGLNTVDNAYTYWVEFLVNDGELLGSAAPASSVYLTISQRNEALSLSWNFDVPWVNDTFVVYRQDFEIGNFNPIDTVIAPLSPVNRLSYRDEPLLNDSTYCYKIEAIGAYTAEGFKEPLINFSQEVCAVPNDTIPPCIVDLEINNFCIDEELSNEQFINYLTWTLPDDCPQTDDIVAYYVYFSPTQNDPLEIIDTVTSMQFNHVRTDSSLTGCYSIQGEDEAGNLGELSPPNCVEDCADYELPNVFTPNNNGQNDLYTPILPYSLVLRVEMKIYNRWGNLVFETNDPDINWDGTDMKSGKELDSGVFFYICRVFINSLDGERAIQTPLEGYIHLYR